MATPPNILDEQDQPKASKRGKIIVLLYMVMTFLIAVVIALLLLIKMG